jgi:hypothetical protein
MFRQQCRFILRSCAWLPDQTVREFLDWDNAMREVSLGDQGVSWNLNLRPSSHLKFHSETRQSREVSLRDQTVTWSFTLRPSSHVTFHSETKHSREVSLWNQVGTWSFTPRPSSHVKFHSETKQSREVSLRDQDIRILKTFPTRCSLMMRLLCRHSDQ